MAKVLIYFCGGPEKRKVSKPEAYGVDCVMAEGFDDLSACLKGDSPIDLLIMGSVPPEEKPKLVKRIKTISNIPVIFFEEGEAVPVASPLSPAAPKKGLRPSRKAGSKVSGSAPENPMEAARQFRAEELGTHPRSAIFILQTHR